MALEKHLDDVDGCEMTETKHTDTQAHVLKCISTK